MRPKALRIIASCIIGFAMIAASGAVLFDAAVVGMGSEVNLLLLVIVLLNLVQATLLFIWADIREGKNYECVKTGNERGKPAEVA
jgi:hypothetical protein